MSTNKSLIINLWKAVVNYILVSVTLNCWGNAQFTESSSSIQYFVPLSVYTAKQRCIKTPFGVMPDVRTLHEPLYLSRNKDILMFMRLITPIKQTHVGGKFNTSAVYLLLKC